MLEKGLFLIINYELVIAITLLLNSFYSNADKVQTKTNKNFKLLSWGKNNVESSDLAKIICNSKKKRSLNLRLLTYLFQSKLF